jgi:UDP-glucose 4-epimerase
VTGGAGFIGSHVADRLLGFGHEVLIVDNLASGSRANIPSSAQFEHCDVADASLAPLLQRWRGEVVVHCAAQVSVAVSMRDPAMDARSNIIGTIRTAQAAADSGCRRFIYVTTGGALYGDPQYLPCDENHPIMPLSPYGLSKMTAERYLDLLAPETMLRLVLRLANVYGPRQRSDGEGGVVSIFAERMKNDLPVEINGDGRQTRDFVYIRDVVDSVVAALDVKHSVTANIATETAVSVLDLYDAMARISGYSKLPVFVPPRVGDVRESRLAIGRARRELSWSPHTPLEQGLKETYASL